MLQKNLNITSAILICIVSFLLFTCSFSDNEFPIQPPFNPDSLTLSFPTGIGFEWTYRDSLSNSFYGLVTTKIISNERDSLGRIIWNVENNSNATKLFLSNQFFVKNDSLFVIDRAPFWQGRIPYLRLVPPKQEEFILFLRIEDTGMPYIVKWNRNKTINSAVGQYKNWLSLVSSRIDRYDSLVVVPQIGILYRYTEFKGIGGQFTYFFKSELISYNFSARINE